MDKINDGGSAFPEFKRAGAVAKSEGGMSLRDYFAANAVAGLLASSAEYESPSEPAEEAYLIADAMLAVRQAKI